LSHLSSLSFSFPLFFVHLPIHHHVSTHFRQGKIEKEKIIARAFCSSFFACLARFLSRAGGGKERCFLVWSDLTCWGITTYSFHQVLVRRPKSSSSFLFPPISMHILSHLYCFVSTLFIFIYYAATHCTAMSWLWLV
jgi:hypothetical protein